MRQISGEIRVVHFRHYQLNSISGLGIELIDLAEIFGGPCSVRQDAACRHRRASPLRQGRGRHIRAREGAGGWLLMPAPKGIPIPEAKAFRLDERIYDSRQTKGWMSEDEELVATHSGKVLIGLNLESAEWDEETGEMTIRMSRERALRAIRWVRHAMEHTGVPRWKIGRLEETLRISDAVLDWD